MGWSVCAGAESAGSGGWGWVRGGVEREALYSLGTESEAGGRERGRADDETERVQGEGMTRRGRGRW